jgi:hypothetical protein
MVMSSVSIVSEQVVDAILRARLAFGCGFLAEQGQPELNVSPRALVTAQCSRYQTYLA